MSDKPVTLAVIIGAHGITGEVRLKLFGESVASLTQQKSFNDGAYTLKAAKETPKGVIARFVEISDRNKAEASRGVELMVPRSALPALAEGEYYFADLIGLAVRSTDGTDIGTIGAVENFGAGDIIEVLKPNGKTFMVPVSVVEITADLATVDADFCE